MKIKFGERIGYALGDFSNNGAYMYVSTFFISFLTIALGMSGTLAGTIIMVVTIFDAINDVIIGGLVDKWHGHGTTYTKVMRFSVVPLAVLLALLFFSPNFGMGGKVAYALIIYALYTIAMTAYQVSFGSLSGAMTDSTQERITLGAFRDWGSNLGGFFVNTFASVLILHFGRGEMNSRGFFVTSLVFCVVLAVGGLISAFVCKERVPVDASQAVPFKQGIKSFLRNRNAIVATIMVCVVNCACVIRASFTEYYAPYCLGGANLIAPILSVMSIIPLAGILFIPALTKKLDRKPMFTLAGISLLIAGIIQLVGNSLTASIVAYVFTGLALCFSITVTWGAIPDIADYGEHKTGVFCPGICYASLTFTMKLIVAIASMSLGVLIDAYGFDANNVTKTAVNGISLWYGLFPVILGIIAIVAARFFTLTHKEMEEVHRELDIIRSGRK